MGKFGKLFSSDAQAAMFHFLFPKKEKEKIICKINFASSLV